MEKIKYMLRTFVIKGVSAYQYFLSPWVGGRCRFYPTCSHYAIEAIETLGLVKGGLKTLFRVLRCHPFCQGGYDPILEDEKK